ncbi:MAG: amidohydrolase family protein [Desulfomonile tiedjei]|nr:amidohydrolase family protein [Desulfomonile tiedjei]
MAVDDLVLDSHAHCGLTVPFQGLCAEWDTGEIEGGVLFSPVEEIYDRDDPRFTDSTDYQKSRRRVHKYLLDVAMREHIYPFFFVWNDFASIPEGFAGVKWHRHPNEPDYRYDSPECARLLEEICARQLPVVLEEEFSNTLAFIMRVAERTTVIIPHMGGLSGGYDRLKSIGVFSSKSVWVDTALAGVSEIRDFAETYGTERILFGSDYPFGNPPQEKEKILDLFTGSDRSAILSGNLQRLLSVTAETGG